MDKQTEKLIDEAYRLFAVQIKNTRGDFTWPNLNAIIDNITVFVQFVMMVVSCVELAASKLEDEFSSDQKRDAAAKIVDEQTDTGWFDLVDGKPLALLVSFAVTVLNVFFGKDWLTRSRGGRQEVKPKAAQLLHVNGDDVGVE